MDSSFRSDSREMRGEAYKWLIGIFCVGLVLTALANAAGLITMPWVVKKQTQIIRASNSYVTTQQTALESFLTEYRRLDVQQAGLRHDPANAELVRALDGQKLAILGQMRQVAGLIPNDVPPDVAVLIGR